MDMKGYCDRCDKKSECTELCEIAAEYVNAAEHKKPKWLIYVGDPKKLDYLANKSTLTLSDLAQAEVYPEDLKNCGLTDKQYDCAYLYYIKELKQEDIAEKLGIAQQTVSLYLREAKKKLDTYLSSLGPDEWEIVLECGLTEKQKQSFYLARWKSMSQRKIAQVLGITRRTVREHVEVAENKVIKHLLNQ